jgi:hypothetical protein
MDLKVTKENTNGDLFRLTSDFLESLGEILTELLRSAGLREEKYSSFSFS